MDNFLKYIFSFFINEVNIQLFFLLLSFNQEMEMFALNCFAFT